ncbi:efflux transporter outer membrane subunit (plasmid) [Roseomonas sp. OT10]|uniref:efflux transporter outer membrane subunit n=1 Tax=Roseomonas cutis TaxID=2897332 RepID=UPI001E3CABA4|nr:efflux transporter outer membrane subunit [Roseomonas sp. OT10]UFN51640.1 efflux transporter outer membrane subunit [Roseomonas sp. OT10]
MTSRRFLLSGVALALLAGCAVGPDFERPAAPDAAGYRPAPLAASTVGTDGASGGVQRFVPGAPVAADWWRAFGSPELDALVAEALVNNADLEAARATLRQAQALVAAGRGGFFPTLGLSAQSTRQRAEPVPTGGTGSFPPYSLHTGRVEVSYAPDTFGGTRREVEGLVAEEDRQRHEVGAAALTLAGNLVNAVVQEAALRAEIQATREIIAASEDSLRLLRSRLALGAVPRSEVLLQESEVAQRRADLPALLKAAEEQRTQVAVLTGRTTDRAPPPVPGLDALRLPETLPVRVPSELVRQRPDILSAEAALQTANARIGVATANMLPRLTLTASYGTAQTAGVDAFTPQGLIWSVAAGLTQPLFQGGRLARQRDAAVAARDVAAAQYRGTVLGAFKNVADALRAVELDAETLQAQREAARVASQSLEIARRQQRLGAATTLEVLTAQQADARARIALIQARAARFADTVALYTAMGGGFGDMGEQQASAGAPGPRPEAFAGR